MNEERLAIEAIDLSKTFLKPPNKLSNHPVKRAYETAVGKKVEKRAVRNVSFSVKQGEVFSLLGSNGAGKSTVLSMLSTILLPDSGDARVCGHSIV
ncbi:MAG: ATP-binding cassette domain-containing protein, partial [Candidatus Diapherotrites archaeon]|nr:ATP-binding cassette domain-containing protein [Candidatus Diapherotrites archaeon]